MKNFQVLSPRTLQDACLMLSDHGDEAKALAGGTALLLLMRQGLFQPKVLINLTGLPGLEGIEATPEGGVRIGPLCQHRSLERSPLLKARFPALAEMARHVANPQVRNMATLGGNLCHADPASDPPAALIALGAVVRVRGPEGERSIPLEDFFLGPYETALRPEEVLTEIQVPPPPPRTGAAYQRFTTTTAEDRPLVCVGIRLTLAKDGKSCEGVRVGIGAATSVPIRAPSAEEWMRGRPLGPDLLQEACEKAALGLRCIEDVRGPAWYRLEMVKVIFRRAAQSALEAARGA